MEQSTVHKHEDLAEIRKHAKIYIAVFAALLALTIVTVAVSYLHLAVVPAILLALFIASIKATLVAAYFMHLVTETRIIYAILGLTMVFFFVLLVTSFYN